MKKFRKVFIVDDDPIYVYAFKRVLNELDLYDELEVYENGADALDAINEIKGNNGELPSVIFLDLNMPIMDGWDFLKDYKKFHKELTNNIAVFLITSSIARQDLERANKFKVVKNYILKPISKEQLLEIVVDYS